jgi:acetyl esterase/lipase
MILPFLLTTVCVAAAAQENRQPDIDIEQRFHRLDRNGDDKITPQEAGGARWFDRLDRDRNGAVTLDELPGQDRRTAGESGAAPQVSTRLDVAYGEHAAQRLDIYAPPGVEHAPVMVYVHGGGWHRGDKRAVGLKAGFFTAKGWVFVSINYRLLPDGKHPRNVEDVARAIAWVHDHIAESGGDPGKLFLMGHSAGAHLVSLVATDGRRLEAFGKSLSSIRGVVALDTNTYDLPTLMQSGTAGLYRQVFGDDPNVWRDASPITHVAAGQGIPPFLICYSRGMGPAMNPDRRTQAQAFAKALEGIGIRVETVDASDRSHGEINQWFGDPEDNKVTGRAAAFFDAILG